MGVRTRTKLFSAPYHSLCYLPAEGHHFLRSQRIVFISITFFILQGLSAVDSYVDAALSFRESDVNLANVTSIDLVLLKKSFTS